MYGAILNHGLEKELEQGRGGSHGQLRVLCKPNKPRVDRKEVACGGGTERESETWIWTEKSHKEDKLQSLGKRIGELG